MFYINGRSLSSRMCTADYSQLAIISLYFESRNWFVKINTPDTSISVRNGIITSFRPLAITITFMFALVISSVAIYIVSIHSLPKSWCTR